MPGNLDDQFNTPLPEDPEEISRGIDELIKMTRPSASKQGEEFLAPKDYDPEETEDNDEEDDGGQPLTAEEALGNLILNRQELALRRTIEHFSGAELPSISVEGVRPSDQDWEKLENINDLKDFGKGTFNPETKDIIFSKAEIFIPEEKDMEKMRGKKLSEVVKYLIETYGKEYYLPGLDYMQWFMSHPNKLQEHIGDNPEHYFHFFGSVVCRASGRWCVPCIYRLNQKWQAQATFLRSHWDSNCRIILLKK